MLTIQTKNELFALTLCEACGSYDVEQDEETDQFYCNTCSNQF